MNCPICKTGTLKQGKTTVMLARGPTTVLLKEVPAEICDNCGEYYLDQDVSARTLAAASAAARNGAELEVLRFAA